MKALLLTTLLLGTFIAPSECTDYGKIDVVRQERYNGCGSDFICADMRVVYRLANNTDHAIYVYGFAYERDFMPDGYVLSFDEQTRGWNYPTGNNKPVPWAEKSREMKSAKKIDAGKSIEFEACHSTAERGRKFARSVYVSCDPKSVPAEFISDGYVIASLE